MEEIHFTNIRVLKQEPCQISHFSMLGDLAESSYNKLNVSNKMCISPNQNLSITQPTTGVFKMLSVQINSCKKRNRDNSSIYDGCATDEEYANNYEQIIQYTKYFTSLVVFVNTGFNTTSKLAVNKFMDVLRQTYTLTRGSEAFVYLSPYTINTDVNVLPWQRI